MMTENSRERNKQIVFDYMLKSGGVFFKRRTLSKNIKELSPAQISNGLRALHEDGCIEYYNKSYTWMLIKNG